MCQEIHAELERLSAAEIAVRLDDEFEPRAGTLVRVELGEAYWHLPPQDFLQLLKELPPGAGSEGVRLAIEKKATSVWHGPSPNGSRDTTT